MKLARRSWLQAGLTLPLLGRSAFAQSFPENRPIRWVVPFPPGGQTDSTARLTAQGLATALPANIVVENRAGGQGTVGSDHVRQSPPDGHTLLFSASIFALGRHILKSTRYDPQADFQPVARVGEAPLLVLAANSVPANTLAELIASAKREPQRYSFALSSLGAAGHLATLEFNRLAGVDISMVPYRGAAAALTDLGSNSVQLFIDAGVAALQQVRAGRMKVLAITTAERSPLAPEVPTAAESGLPGFVFNSWYGVWAPARPAAGRPRQARRRAATHRRERGGPSPVHHCRHRAGVRRTGGLHRLHGPRHRAQRRAAEGGEVRARVIRKPTSFSAHASSSPLPPAAAFVRLLHLLQFALEPRHQIFCSLLPASFIEDLGLDLGNALLCGLALPANMICLLLQAATIDNLARLALAAAALALRRRSRSATC